MREHLAELGETSGYFGEILESGSHQATIELLLTRRVDASAIDSTVLDLEVARKPALAGRLRVIGTLGPSPIPPWVILTSIEPALRARLRTIFLAMHEDSSAAALLARAGVARFAQVEDADYDPIRAGARSAAGISL